MRVVDIIAEKRDGGRLSREQLEFLIKGYMRGGIPDYQVAAWLMAVVLRGMDNEETKNLTQIMVNSGERLDLNRVTHLVADKHSTGGVGDKTTLVLAPLVAASGVPVGKISGRALGFTGGTLDKLEAIPGFQADLSPERFLTVFEESGVVVAGHTADLAPADGALYALRDVTATVESIPLIASSIMSKKIAGGANVVVLDVKVGQGAFMKTRNQAEKLAETMVAIGEGSNLQVAAVLSDMSQPLGNSVGNALEVREAIETLQGTGPEDFWEHCRAVAGQLLLLANRAQNIDEAQTILEETLSSGEALARFATWIKAQGGTKAVVDDLKLLPQAQFVEGIPAPQTGYVAAIDAMEIGLTAMRLGAGREQKGDPVDHAVGIVLGAKVGDYVEQGDTLLTVHGNDEKKIEVAKKDLAAAYGWSSERVEPPPLLYDVIKGT